MPNISGKYILILGKKEETFSIGNLSIRHLGRSDNVLGKKVERLAKKGLRFW